MLAVHATSPKKARLTAGLQVVAAALLTRQRIGGGGGMYVKQTYCASVMPCQIFSGVREVELRPHPEQEKPDELVTGAPGDDVAVTKLASLYVTAYQSDDVSDTVPPQAVPTPPSSQAKRKPAATV